MGGGQVWWFHSIQESHYLGITFIWTSDWSPLGMMMKLCRGCSDRSERGKCAQMSSSVYLQTLTPQSTNTSLMDSVQTATLCFHEWCMWSAEPTSLLCQNPFPRAAMLDNARGSDDDTYKYSCNKETFSLSGFTVRFHNFPEVKGSCFCFVLSNQHSENPKKIFNLQLSSS